MAHKKFSKWAFKNKLFLQIKIANELWYYSRENEKENHLIFIGWYQRENQIGKLFTINLFNFSLQIGISL